MKILTIFFLVLISFHNLFAQNNASSEYGTWKVWGVVFADYFYKTAGDSSGSSLEYSGYKKDFNSCEFRRVNIGFDYSFNENFDGVISLSYDGQEFTTDGKRTVYLRDAAVNWKNIFANSELSAGLIPTPGFTVNSEKFWSYRFIERTILDQRGFLSSRDLGVMLRGAFDREKKFNYYLMIGNGKGARLESNKFKRFYGNLMFNSPDKKITFNIYGDYEPSGPSQNKTTIQSFLGVRFSGFGIGVEAFEQIQKNGANIANTVPWGVSVFTRGILKKDKLSFFLRYDLYDSDEGKAKQHFVSTGLDYTPDKRVHITPNLWLNAYSKGKVSEVVPRITFMFDTR